MKKLFLSFFLLGIASSLAAQSSVAATASVTIMHPVGTAGIMNEEADVVGQPSLMLDYAKASPVFLQETKTGLTRFSVVSNSFLYTVAVLPYVTDNNVLLKVEENNLVPLQVKPLNTPSFADAFALGADAAAALPALPLRQQKRIPDVAIHFN